MGFFDRLFSRKYSEARQVLVVNQIGQCVSSPKNYEAFSQEGYQTNVIAYKCISILSKTCASIPWELYQGDREIEKHPILDLLKNPNPMQSRAAFFEALVAYFSIAGNSYVEAVRIGDKGVPYELWPVRPDKMKIIAGRLGLPAAFVFKANAGDKTWPVDQISGASSILHMKSFHPTDPWYGMSPIEAATYSVDQHNESSKWNLSLLQNSGTPSGAMVVQSTDSNPSGSLSDPQFHNLKKQMETKIAGSKNAGRILLLEGGVDWRSMGFSPHDMEWMQGRQGASRDIALAFGVPPILLNIPGDSTYANYKEARLSFYEDTVIPLLDMIRDELNHWLLPMFKAEGLELKYDMDDIPALDVKRGERFVQVSGAGFLTTNEKRTMLGFEPIEGGDVLLVPSGQTPITEIGFNNMPESTEPEIESTDDPTDDSEGEADDDTEDQEKSSHKFSQINLVNQKEKQKSARQANDIRDRLSSGFYHDLKEEFEDQAKKLENVLSNIDPRTMEFAAIKVLSDSKDLEKIIAKYIRRGIVTFGTPIINGSKFFGPEYEVKSSARFNQFTESFVKKRTAEAIQHIEGTSIKKARRAIKEFVLESQELGEGSQWVAKQIRLQFETVSNSRASVIARTEMAIASSSGSLEAAKSLDIPDLMKEWVSTNDDRTRDDPANADHSSANGQRVNLNEKFTINPDASMDGPCDGSAPAEQIINCRCVLVYAREGKTLIPEYEVM
jgi:HK97 family phage portal protein